MARLGDMLVEEKLCSAAQIEEGLETQVVHGGRLGTNLVELGFLPEKELGRMLGKQYGVAYASGEMQPDPAAMGAAAALLGGIVVWGSNNSITQEARKEMVAAEAKQAALIETIGLRAVP